MNNAQTFSQSSDQYAKARPRYPESLFSYLNEVCVEHERVWDCATGNGQAAVSLTKYFGQVEATDISQEQIGNSIPNPKVRYSVSSAEQTVFENESFDLVTVALAIHWFDREMFYQEVERVLKPNGVLAVWGYGFLDIEPAINQLIFDKLLKPIDPFWAEGNRLVINGYRDLVLPFEPIEITKKFFIEVEWNKSQLCEYFRTWSAVKRYMTEKDTDPVAEFESTLKPIWNDEEIKVVKMPIFLKASRKF